MRFYTNQAYLYRRRLVVKSFLRILLLASIASILSGVTINRGTMRVIASGWTQFQPLHSKQQTQLLSWFFAEKWNYRYLSISRTLTAVPSFGSAPQLPLPQWSSYTGDRSWEEEVQSGWPFKSWKMNLSTTTVGPFGGELSFGKYFIVLDVGQHEIHLPLNPRLIPLLGNLLCWLAIVWILYLLLSSLHPRGHLHQILRFRRHHCVVCGYDLSDRESPKCSECGFDLNRPKRRKQRISTEGSTK